MNTPASLTNLQLHQKLGQVSDEISRTNQDTIVTKGGKPNLVLLSPWRYQHLIDLERSVREQIELVPWNQMPAEEKDASKAARAEYLAGKTTSLQAFLDSDK